MNLCENDHVDSGNEKTTFENHNFQGEDVQMKSCQEQNGRSDTRNNMQGEDNDREDEKDAECERGNPEM